MNRHACEQAVDCHKHSRSDNPILMVYLSGFLGVHISWMFSSLNIAFFGLFLITFLNFFFFHKQEPSTLIRRIIGKITNIFKFEQTYSGIVVNVNTNSQAKRLK